ncbi:MAG: response regulator [Candidatus Omnitrophica bacterium]|nr:response regulator [Candidatus Omnitrophota bacterium]
MKKKILIIDDDKDLTWCLAERLSEEGYDAISAEDADEAILMAKKHSPDLMLLDIILPGMPGLKLAEYFYNDPGIKDISIIFLTGILTKEDEEKGRSVGGRHFIAKPYDPEKLLHLISETLKKKT